MDRLVYLAASSARNALNVQGVTNHNLANASTPGFRADMASTTSVELKGPGFESRTFVVANQLDTSFQPGTLISTERPLDVAIAGEGWIAIQTPDGGEGYTRGGDLRVGTGGILVTGRGDPVIGNAGPIAVPPAESLVIGTDGTISIRPVGEGATNVVEIDRIKLVNPPIDALAKGLDGRFRGRDGQPQPPDAAVRLSSGTLESSNVNAVSALVQMIEQGRAFEMQVKLMKAAEDMDVADSQILGLNG